MRYNVLKTHSSKAERIVYELLKELKIPFRHRWIVNGCEVDFLIGRYTIEINGHEQNTEKNLELIHLGYVPIHFQNKDVLNNRQSIKDKIKKYVDSY